MTLQGHTRAMTADNLKTDVYFMAKPKQTTTTTNPSEQNNCNTDSKNNIQ